jgi:mRNA interferase RelE/StbE
MTFRIEISEEAKHDLGSFPKKDAERILLKLFETKDKPNHYLQRLAGVSYWKLRVGDYRVIIILNTKDKIIFVVKVGHRKNVYK